VIKSLLIANRGEIACRIIRTARRLGIRTVAVYSDADAKALHVRDADEAVHIGPSPARESYLIGEKIIAAAKATGAEAIHPGYGFLSENAAFAQSVIDAGLVWVGPKPASITAMGLKDAAKERMIAAGVPVTPGYLGENQDPDHLKAEADAIGYPVLIKAVAGGGGKGMRRVDASEDFADALLSCKREAASSFGDDRVLIEKYILSPRHIEVQVFGDTHGDVVHLFERDCSLQRRHQKVIEEAPAPGMDEATREAICAAAVRAAKAVDYVGAGTIEFIADASEGLRADRIWFMEMNTRLQVEHPVTEEITGVDLVEWQLLIASGYPLPLEQNQLAINGHAIEARLYAEDPVSFLPSIGKLQLYRPHTASARIETGYSEGDEVSPFYDPMIEKVIVHAADRWSAAQQLAMVCKDINVWPVKTNAPLLWRALEHPEFLAGDVTTGFIEKFKSELSPPAETPDNVIFAGAVALAVSAWNGKPTSLNDGKVELRRTGKADVWCEAFGFRLNRPIERGVVVKVDGEIETVDLSDSWRTSELHAELVEGGWAVPYQGQWFFASAPRQDGAAAGGAGDGSILSPMPGRIIAVDVIAGAPVTKGQKLVTLEAMKMEHSLTAPFDGIVAELNSEVGGQVSEGALLVRIDKAE
jgi:3-methylcrotonyl-CoA carboxylase alpha subunit